MKKVSKNRNILLVCYGFPPNTGIGGRRWAKLARELANRGFNVEVINAKLPDEQKQSSWKKETDHPNIKVHSIPMNFPAIFLKQIKTLKDKVCYALTVKYMNFRLKGTIYDTTVFAEKTFLNKARELVKSCDIGTLIVTGAPFNLLYYSAKLRNYFPELKLIADYRDPWLDSVNYGMPNLNEKRKRNEEDKQKVVFQNADFIVTPYQFMISEFEKTALDCHSVRSEYKVLTHFYDSEDLKVNRQYVKRPDTDLKIIYGGALYSNTELVLKQFSKTLCDFERESPEKYNQLKITMYIRDFDQGSAIFKSNSVVKVFPVIGKEFFQKIQESDMPMVLLADYNKNYRTTKFMEYLPFKKPLFYIGPIGEVAKYIDKNDLGYVFENGNVDWNLLVDDFNNQKLRNNPDFDYSKYSLSKVTDQLIELIEK